MISMFTTMCFVVLNHIGLFHVCGTSTFFIVIE